MHGGQNSCPKTCSAICIFLITISQLHFVILPLQRNDYRLSDQQVALNNGQNPLPIYLAINVKQDTISTLDFKGIYITGHQSYIKYIAYI